MEQARGCLGALVGIAAVGALGGLLPGGAEGLSPLIPPMGASAVLLFAAPSSPLAQPWSVLGGNTLAAVVGVTAARLLPDPVIAAALAVAVAIAGMFLLRCLHPPSGAIALTAVLGGDRVAEAGWGFVLTPVLVGSVIILAAAIVYNRLIGRDYPHLAARPAGNLHGTSDAPPMERIGVRAEDIDRVLGRHDGVLDVDRDDMAELFLEAELEAAERRFGTVTCADVMSRDVVTVTAGTPLPEAVALLRRHRIKALPVVAATGAVAGILTATDVLEKAGPLSGFPRKSGLSERVRAVVRRPGGRPRTVGDIMSAPVRSAAPDLPLARLVPAMADGGLHHLPVVDGAGRVVGILTQSDVLAALFKRPEALSGAFETPVREAGLS